MSAEKNMNTMHRYFDLLFSKHSEDLINLFADDIEWFIIPTGTEIIGKKQLRSLAASYWAASPHRVKKLVNFFAAGDFVCLEYLSGGTLTEQADFLYQKIYPTGRKYELQRCFVFHFKSDGQIDRVREYFDMETIRIETGQGSRS